MTVLFAILLVVHGLTHLLGFAKAFGWAGLPQLTQPISQVFGVLWLIAGFLFLAGAGALFLWPRWWWAIGACAIILSMFVIGRSWVDAKFGALANLVALVGVVCGFLAQGPMSLRAAYDRDVDRALTRVNAPAEPITDPDLAGLPAPVQRYLRVSGVVGQPRVRNFRARMHGRIRNGPDAGWMPLTAEQYNVIDQPERHFYLNASMFLIPLQGYHRYVGSSATMRVRVAAIVPLVDAYGEEMTEAETVTLFNDMCVMAPATLVDRGIVWEPVDARTARASFTNGRHTIRAALSFNEAGELTNFRSDDRYRHSPDGKGYQKARWSTPLGAYRSFGSVRLASGGEARWDEPGREFTYIELTLDNVQYNLHSR
jgi:hypothetical protein